MKTKFLSAILLGGLLAASTGTFVSCKDYDDDITNLQSQITTNAEAIAALQSLLQQGVVISNVSSTSNGLVLTTSAGQSYTLTNGADGKDGKDGKDGQADVWTIGNDGYWYLNGSKTDYRAVGQDGQNGTNGTNGTNGSNGANGQDGGYYLPKSDGYFYYVTTDADGKTTETKSDLQWTSGTISAAMTGSYVVLSGVEGVPDGLKINTKLELKSLVYQPQFYYEGIEAIGAEGFEYTYKTVAKVDADGEYGEDAPTDATKTNMVPGLYADYHINPTNAYLPESTGNYSFLVYDKDYVVSRAGAATFKPSIYKRTEDGKLLTVYAKVTDAAIKTIKEDKQVTVLALQVQTGDTIVTSDYAAVYATNLKDPVLAHTSKTLAATCKGESCDINNHLYTTAKDAIDNDAEYQVVYNSNGIRLDSLVQSHYEADSKHSLWDTNAASGTVEKSGFKYSFELVGYHLGTNNTSESAHAAIASDGVTLRPQMTKDGKQQAYGYEQNKAEKDREPLVRVILTDTISNKIAAVGYIKFKIVEQEEVVPTADSVVGNFAFESTVDYTVDCAATEQAFELKWYQVEEQIIAKLEEKGISKETFHSQFTLDDVTEATKNDSINVDQYDGTETTSKTKTKIGAVSMTNTDKEATQTEVLKWVVKNNQAYTYFKNSDTKKISAIIRFTRKVGDVHQYVYVTFTWAPANINVTPSGAILDEPDKIKEYWYAANNGTAATGYSDIHANVETVGQTITSNYLEVNQTGAANDEFVSDILNTFNKNQVIISGVSSVYTEFQDAKLKKTILFVEPQKTTPVVGNSGTQYDITVGDNGYALYATVVGGTGKEKIVELTAGAASAIQSNIVDDKHFLRYQDNDIAKDILNHADHKELKDGETFTAKLKITAANCADVPFTLTNNEFYVKFLRPVTVSDPNDNTFVDATTNGAKDYLSLTFVDWRDHNFTDETKTQRVNYFEYYGVKSIECLTNEITTNLNGNDLNKTLLKEVTDRVIFTFTEPTEAEIQNGATVDGKVFAHYFGTLEYQNNGTTVGNFKIRVPFDVAYDWGTIRVYVVCTINATEANN